MKNFSRRNFVRATSLLAATAGTALYARDEKTAANKPTKPAPKPTSGPTKLQWVEEIKPDSHPGTAFGVPWPQGQQKAETSFVLRTDQGDEVPMQTWTTATWPDGSIKWTGHAIAPESTLAATYSIVPGKATSPKTPLTIEEGKEILKVDTGVIRCTLPTTGESLIASVDRGGKTIMRNGRLFGTRQDTPDRDSKTEAFTSSIKSVSVEQDGPVRAVIKVDGVHSTAKGREWLPFSVRLYFHAGSDSIRMVHTFIYDGDEYKDFISSLGVRFNVPMQDEAYNRHVRFAGQDKGIWAESVQGLTGLRRDPGAEVREAQIAGKKVPAITTWDKRVSERVHWIPTWSDYTLTQPNANGFNVRKRTKAGHAWINADQGKRSNGLAYIGGASGGVSVGMRDFWKLHPTQIDIRDAATEEAEVTMWIWSPEAQPMDIRFYHDGFGQALEGPVPGVDIEGIDSRMPERPYDKQLDALNVTYEDYEPGFGTPKGVARSTDLYFWILDSTPSNETIAQQAESAAQPPQLAPRPGDLHRARVFSEMWDLPNRTSPQLAAIEDRLDWSIEFYHDQVEQRHWYGFWDYGDVMHTYDSDRHVWRYDVGGYAWDNSELSTDMWLWYSFLRTGDAKAFRLAEAMNRHNRDVDIYHLGRFAGFGTRHNVQHWGCSAKQLRISTCMNRRFHYFLTTDERTGDVLQEVVEADKQLSTLNPRRKLPGEPFTPDQSIISPGTDYGAAVSNWLTAWERTGDPKYRGWIENSMRDIGTSKWGFFTTAFNYDPETKKMTEIPNTPPASSHLSIMFGLPEVCSELLDLLDVPEFKAAWLQYCELVNAPREVSAPVLGPRYKPQGFATSHSKIVAYAAAVKDDEKLAARAVKDFKRHEWGPKPKLETKRLVGPEVLNPVDEASWVSTNDSAQWGLAGIQISALIPEALSEK